MHGRMIVSVIVLSFYLVETLPADVIITTESRPALNLPGFTTHRLTATSDVPGELIAAVDFAGDGSNDPATGRGFFGPMYHVAPPYGGVFERTGSIGIPPPPDEQYDSHYSVKSTEIVPVPGRLEEGPHLLQAAWAWQTPIGQSFELAQIVVPDNSIVTYRGNFAVTRGGTFVDTPEVTGTIGVPEPATVNLVVLAIIGWVCVGFGRSTWAVTPRALDAEAQR